jgi:hypothetical protein
MSLYICACMFRATCVVALTTAHVVAAIKNIYSNDVAVTFNSEAGPKM